MKKEETTLAQLRPGAIFVTRDGTYAVKSEYRYESRVDSQYECILLESGEFAHFPNKNQTIVREIEIAKN